MSYSLKSAVRRGLTLIELVVVMAILAVLAAMVIPRLDFLKTQAEHAAAASTTGDLGTMIQTFKASSTPSQYPSFDTLVAGSTVYSKLQGQMTKPSLVEWTVPGPGGPGSDWYRSLSEAGFTYGYSHDAAESNASNSGKTAVHLINQIFDGQTVLATLVPTGGSSTAAAVRNAIYPGGATRIVDSPAVEDDPETPEDEAQEEVFHWEQVSPGTIPTGRKLVVMGIGPKCSMIGNIMVAAPVSNAGTDDSKATYARYLAVFEVFADGTPAKLRMVTDHRLRQIGDRVDQFKSSGQIN